MNGTDDPSHPPHSTHVFSRVWAPRNIQVETWSHLPPQFTNMPRLYAGGSRRFFVYALIFVRVAVSMFHLVGVIPSSPIVSSLENHRREQMLNIIRLSWISPRGIMPVVKPEELSLHGLLVPLGSHVSPLHTLYRDMFYFWLGSITAQTGLVQQSKHLWARTHTLSAGNRKPRVSGPLFVAVRRGANTQSHLGM